WHASGIEKRLVKSKIKSVKTHSDMCRLGYTHCPPARKSHTASPTGGTSGQYFPHCAEGEYPKREIFRSLVLKRRCRIAAPFAAARALIVQVRERQGNGTGKLPRSWPFRSSSLFRGSRPWNFLIES